VAKLMGYDFDVVHTTDTGRNVCATSPADLLDAFGNRLAFVK
jgi:hypothetical protein